jgi:hypothetical protein
MSSRKKATVKGAECLRASQIFSLYENLLGYLKLLFVFVLPHFQKPKEEVPSDIHDSNCRQMISEEVVLRRERQNYFYVRILLWGSLY